MSAWINPNISEEWMKRLFIVLALVVSLVGCDNSKLDDQFKAYRGMTSQQIFNKAESSAAKKSYTAAVKDYEALDALFPFGPNARQGLLDSIYAYYMDQESDMALVSAQRYIRLYPRGPNLDYALYMEGYIQFNQHQGYLAQKFKLDPAKLTMTGNQNAFTAFVTLARLYPNSPYANDALMRAHYLRDMLARHELYIAQYYYARHAYVAAVNRSSGIVQHYNGTASVKPALEIMVKSYRKMQLNKLASNTNKILQANYPGTVL